VISEHDRYCDFIIHGEYTGVTATARLYDETRAINQNQHEKKQQRHM